MKESNNIYLIGFMGSGKSHWGKIWAGKYGLRLLDLDDEIEREHGMSIDSIFEKKGEGIFRKTEAELLKQTVSYRNALIACGGGVPCFGDNMEWMLANGTVIYLQATPAYVLRRISHETDKRPLLKKLDTTGILSFIEKKLEEREPIYRQAHYILDVEKLNEESLDSIIYGSN